MFIVHPDVAIIASEDSFDVEDRSIRLKFAGAHGRLAHAVVDACRAGATSVAMISSHTDVDIPTIEAILRVLEEESFLVRMDYADVVYAEEAILAIKRAALFWNKHVMAQHFPRRLFGGEATRLEVLGWGIEFYHFVRSAREYMARGASRTAGPSAVLSKLWNHFVEEAFHDGIFLDGLVACGLERSELERRPPLASTMALLNHLWECAEAGDLEYAAVFAVMQPGASRPETADVQSPSGKGLSGRDRRDSRGLRDLIWNSHVDPDHPAAA